MTTHKGPQISLEEQAAEARREREREFDRVRKYSKDALVDYIVATRSCVTGGINYQVLGKLEECHKALRADARIGVGGRISVAAFAESRP